MSVLLHFFFFFGLHIDIIYFLSLYKPIGTSNTFLSFVVGYREVSKFKLLHGAVRAQASNVGAGSFEGSTGNENHKIFSEGSSGENLSEP